MSVDIQRAIDEHEQVIRDLRGLLPSVEAIAARMSACLLDGGRVLWFGNGGSASQAQHLAAELVGRYEHDRPGIASLALTTDTAVLTAIANDYAFEDVFARQIEAIARPGDVAVGLSTSGNSANVLRGIEVGRAVGCYTVGLTGGSGGRLVAAAEANLVVPSTRTSRIQEAHILVGHILCELIETSVLEGARNVRDV